MRRITSLLILLFLLFSQFANGDPSDEIDSMENFVPGEEESLATVHNCVNVITGSFFQVDHDLIVDGPEPLQFTRCYDSDHLLFSLYGFGFRSQCPLKIGAFWKGKKNYHAAIEMQEGIYFEFRGDHNQEQKKIRFSLDPKIFSLGLSNYSDDGMSAHTNMDLVRATFTYRDKKKHEGQWTVNFPNGSCRNYISAPTAYGEKGALLRSIQNPSGNHIHFTYVNNSIPIISSTLSFMTMHQTNAKGKKLNTIERMGTNTGYCMKGSNGQTVYYHLRSESHVIRTKNGKRERTMPFLNKVSASHLPTTHYTIDTSGKKEGFCKIGRVEKPEGRVLTVSYDSKGRVKTLCAPIRKSLFPLYTFTYENGLTQVTNALGTKTSYRITKNKRIKAIENDNSGTLYCSKDFFWNEERGWLKGKAYRISNNFVNKAISYRYDGRGNIVQEIFFGNLSGNGVKRFSFNGVNAVGNVEQCSTYFTYSHNGFNLKLSESDDYGLKTRYSYHPKTNLLAKKCVLHHDVIQERVFYTYDDNAVLIKTIEDNGSSEDPNNFAGVTERLITTITPVSDHFPSLGKPAEIRESYYDPVTKQEHLLRYTKCTYSRHGFLTKKDVYDANMIFAYSEETIYDKRDLVIKTIDPLGQETYIDYDANHNKIYEEKVGSGKKTWYSYDRMNRLIQVKEIHDNGDIFITKHAYDLAGNRTATIDSYGNKTTYVYDRFNRLIKTHYPPMKNFSGKIFTPKKIKKYDHNHRVICETDERGFSTTTTYTAYDKPITITHPDGTVEKFEYFCNGRLKNKWNGDGVRTTYAYDPEGRIIKEIFYDVEGNFVEETTKTYRGKRLIRETDFAKNLTEYHYDAAGRKIAEIRHSPEGERKTTYSYDPLNRLSKTLFWLEDGKQRIECKEYDFLDRVVEERVEDHTGRVFRKTAYAYDRNGNQIIKGTYLSDEKTLVERTAYDSHNKPILQVDPLGHQTTIAYDYCHKNSLDQNVLKITTTDPMGGLQVEVFDAFDRSVSLQKKTADGQIVSHHEMEYGIKGNKQKQIEHIYQDGFSTRDYVIAWTYDSMGRVNTLIEQDKERKCTRYTYDKAGRKQTIEKPDGVILTHTYYPTGLLKMISSSDETIAYTYCYDANHNPIEMIDDVAKKTTSRRYNAFNERLEETQGNGLSTSYQYDPLGRVTQVTLLNGKVTFEYVYDAANLIKTRYKDYQETYSAFDRRGLPSERSINDGAILIRMGWDERGRKILTDSSFWYEHLDIFDAKGNLLQLHYRDSHGPVSEIYSYDPLDQLIKEEGASNHNSDYDSLYNRHKKDGYSYVVNDLNQYENDGHTQYSYDANGNLIEKVDHQGKQAFTYDAFNRLTRVAIPDGVITYHYDAEGRRLTKETVKNGLKITRAFLYQFDTEIGAVNENNELFQLRILRNGKGEGSTLAVELDQNLYTSISDHIGSIRCLVDVKKEVVGQSYRYSAFGEQVFIDDGALENPWGFANKRRDSETGHIHFLKRDYLPNLGRWLTTDPLDFADGPNLYAYVRNNPFTFADPDGQFVFVIPLICFGGGTATLASLSTIATYTAVGLATGAAAYSGYQLGQKYDLGSFFDALGTLVFSQSRGAPFGIPGSLVLNQTSIESKEGTEKANGGSRHTPDQEALKDLVSEATQKGTKPLSSSDTKVVDKWAKEVNYPGYRANPSDLEGSHWKDGPHIHFPGGGIRGHHIPVEPGIIL